ncbi:hypothetical protein SELMODRAFT_92605 [Selaginella moellendorffii]|uniref:Pentacotripeptide-repeat region of PRORP domain-containing protein n=2 Tax=Selaginella moellendorffii TaxID=88036 RepID=D8RFB6_SELML|nr:hypothetical protein SELMODRAFT_92605 [Selaginella moellendorffii]
MPQPSSISWSSLIAASDGASDRSALEIFRSMEQHGESPDAISLTSLLGACGRMDSARHYIRSMAPDHGLSPSREHYCAMIDILGRAGELELAEGLIHAMPFPADAAAWGSLLAACRIHRDVERGEIAAARAMEVDRDDGAVIVLLDDLYCQEPKK